MYDCFTCAPDNNNTKLVPGNEGGSGQRLSVCHYVSPLSDASIFYLLFHILEAPHSQHQGAHPYAGL